MRLSDITDILCSVHWFVQVCTVFNRSEIQISLGKCYSEVVPEQPLNSLGSAGCIYHQQAT
jgi:hypothetical protein